MGKGRPPKSSSGAMSKEELQEARRKAAAK